MLLVELVAVGILHGVQGVGRGRVLQENVATMRRGQCMDMKISVLGSTHVTFHSCKHDTHRDCAPAMSEAVKSWAEQF